ncbi:HERV-H LTR-associating protein 2 [Mixophyes fleayi]|uniref:HERV-H LTR-associating protein 2 n=1 Tax=Mixophyes fleayi TaxID=3061075 RepID=UPI003F4E3809
MQFFLFVKIFSGLSLVYSTTEIQVWGELHRTVTLPCSFPDGKDEVIHWRDRKEQIVHSYYNGKDQLDKQNKSYSNRTSMFLNEVKKGNASLQLRDLKKNDENTYLCYVGTTEGRTETVVVLQVADFSHSIEYKWVNHELHLKCYVNKVYPEDNVLIIWKVDSQTVQENMSNESSHIVINSSLSHHCIISHSIVENTWTGNWKRKESIEGPGDNLTCACTFCKTSNMDLLAIYLKRNTTEQVTVASMNSTSDIIPGTNYGNRVHTPVEHSLYLGNLGMNDNGEYTCVIKTTTQMDIEMTSVNIEEKHQSRNYLSLIASVLTVLAVAIYIRCHVCQRKNSK